MNSIHQLRATGPKRIGILLVWLLLAAASRANNSATATTSSGLVAAYSFDEGTGTTAVDASGNGNNGTIGAATWASTGKYDSALAFNGTSAQVTINDSASLHLTTAMTLEAWVNPSTVSGAWRDVIYKGDDNYFLEATSTQGAVPGSGASFGGAAMVTYGTAALAANTWTHLAVTYDGTMLRLYVNGAELASEAQTGNILTSTNPLQIGGDGIYGQYFQGMIDEVRVYNVALTAAQIQSDMNTPIGSAPPDTQPPTAPSGLVAAYSFDEGTGTTAVDASGNGNNGTIGAATWASTGKYDSALAFNGTSAQVTINDSASLHLTTAMTLEAWVNPSTVSGAWRDVIYKGDDNYFLEATSTQGAVPGSGASFGGAAMVTYGTAALAANTWTHLAVTYDGTMLRLYVNGAELASEAQTGNILTSTNPLQIGGDGIYGQYFQGMIDEVRVYNVALTAAQIQSDMNTPIGSAPPDTQPPTAPSTPNGVVVSAHSDTEVAVQWNASVDTGVSGVKGYRVFRNGIYVELTTGTSFLDDGLTPDTQYCYTVDAYDYDYNRSSLSAQACATTPASSSAAPDAPSNLAATAVATTSVTINWQDNSNDELGFQIERAPSVNGPWVIVGTGGANVASYTDTGLSPATTYYYRVSAFN